MLFSAHVVDTSPTTALRRRTPKPADVPGLHSARTGIGAPFTGAIIPRPQLSREVMFAGWENAAALDHFLAEHSTGQAFNRGWHVRMELFRAVGVWPGLDADMQAEAALHSSANGPSVAITIGTAYLKTVVPFLRVNRGLEHQFLETPSGIWGTAMSNLPQRLVATLTVWESPKAATQYMRNGAHGAAVAAHFDPAKDPTGHTFVTGGGFFGFRPISVHGALAGKNPIPADLLTAPR